MPKTKIIPADILQQSLWFTSLELDLQQAILEHGRLINYDIGEAVFAPEMAGGGFYCLLTGMVRMINLSSTGTESLFTVFEPITWFGDVVIFETTINKYSAIAQKNSEIFVLSPNAINEISTKFPIFWKHIACLMSLKLGLLLTSYEAFRHLNGAGRLAARLSVLSSNHGMWTDKKRVTISVSQDDLANMSQLSRSRTNTLLKEFERLGVLQLSYGKLELLNLELLQEIANGSIEID